MSEDGAQPGSARLRLVPDLPRCEAHFVVSAGELCETCGEPAPVLLIGGDE